MTDVAAAYGMAGRPFWLVVAVLFVIVMGRSHLFYWLGRGVNGSAARLAGRAGTGAHPEDEPPRGGVLGRTARLLHAPAAQRGVTLVRRWGAVAVTAAYLTVGVQTAVFVGAGLIRMPYLRFTLASVPGAIAWAFVWGTVGLGAVWAGVTLAAESPWALGVVAALLVALVTWLVLRRRSRARSAAGVDHGADHGADQGADHGAAATGQLTPASSAHDS